MKFHSIAPHERSRFQPGIVALEQTARYPLGDDFFQLDHGPDYFAFFDRLGEVHYWVAQEEEQVVAVGAGVLRQVPDRRGGTQSAWYLCDLKVHPDYQQRRLSVRLLQYALTEGLPRCDRGYSISMNPGDGRPNRLVRVLERLPHLPFRYTTRLDIYSLDATQMTAIAPLLAVDRGAISYRSLKGIKDLRLQSTGACLPLLHVQWGKTPELDISGSSSEPLPGFTHMFCLPADDRLAQVFSRQGIAPMATASLVSHNLDTIDWRFVLTSDI